MPEAAFGHLVPHARRGQVSTCRASEIMQREVCEPMLHTQHGDVQRVNADMQYRLARIAAALWEYEIAATPRAPVSA